MVRTAYKYCIVSEQEQEQIVVLESQIFVALIARRSTVQFDNTVLSVDVKSTLSSPIKLCICSNGTVVEEIKEHIESQF